MDVGPISYLYMPFEKDDQSVTFLRFAKNDKIKSLKC